MAELLEDCRTVNTEGRYRHVGLMQECLNSFRGAVCYKDSIATIIRGFEAAFLVRRVSEK